MICFGSWKATHRDVEIDWETEGGSLNERGGAGAARRSRPQQEDGLTRATGLRRISPPRKGRRRTSDAELAQFSKARSDPEDGLLKRDSGWPVSAVDEPATTGDRVRKRGCPGLADRLCACRSAHPVDRLRPLGHEIKGQQRVPMIGFTPRVVVAMKRISQFRGVVLLSTFVVRCDLR